MNSVNTKDYNIYLYNFKPIFKQFTLFEEKLSRLEQIRYIENPNEFYKETAYNKEVDGKLSYFYFLSQIRLKKDEKSSRYLTHGIDFYKGNFQAQMVRGLINYCNLNKKSTILDIFCGSGTTLVESKLLGYHAIGIDINPIACLNSKIKTELLDTPVELLLSCNNKYLEISYYDKNRFYYENFNSFLKLPIKDLFYIFIFTRSLSDERYVYKDKTIAFFENYEKIILLLKRFENLKKTIEFRFIRSDIIHGDVVLRLTQIKAETIDAIITSPPYIDAINYIENDIDQIKYLYANDQIDFLIKNSLGCKLQNIRLTEKEFWSRIEKIFAEAFRILKSKSNFILVVGFYRNMKENFIRIAQKYNFQVERVLEREVISFKKKKTIEYVLFFKKP